MKLFTPKIAVTLLFLVFALGFVNVAEAAYAGKKKVADTETVVSSSEELNAMAPATLPAAPAAADVSTILLVILSFILPPLAVYLLFEDINNAFWLNVVLTLLFWIPGVIHALYLVLTH
jgi:uncharacterized membrane protein YqaE (UPF0057 family)